MPTPSRGPSRGPSRAAPSRAVSRARSDQDTKELEGGTDPILVTIKGDRKIFYPPSWGYRKIILKPSQQLVLDWVYGIRGSDVSKNLWILTTGELVYFVATTVVIYNRLKETQRHYRGHTEDITCMDILAKKHLGLSGQKKWKNP